MSTEIGLTTEQDVEEKFLKGVAISTWQNSGDADSNWTRFTKKRILFGLRSTVADGAQDAFPDFWNRYEEDIKLTKELGSNVFRFSFEWSRIEPEKGKIDPSAMQRFHAILDCLERNEIVPCATFHHFTHPGWFEDLGAFEKDENIELFLNYCRIVFEEFGHRIKLWATFNEPTCYMFCSYLIGAHTPGKMFRFFEAGLVLKNILKAHVLAYKAIKEMPGGERVLVGLVHHHLRYETLGDGLLFKHAQLMADWFTYLWGWDVVHEFMMTGRYKWKLPLLGEAIDYEYAGKPPVDFWGINYYTRAVISRILTPATKQGEIMTDMMYPIVPSGLYEAIKKSSELGVPMYITETGIADSKDNRRHLMVKGYTNEVVRAVKDGYDVRGFMYWTLVDNFEWNMGYVTRFGIYRWEPDGSVDRELRQGGKALQWIYETWPADLERFKQFAKAAAVPDFMQLCETEYQTDEDGWLGWIGKQIPFVGAT